MNVQTFTPDSAEAALFDHVLSCEANLRSAFLPGAGPGRPAHAHALLSSLAVIEDLSRDQGHSEHDERPPHNVRMEAKLDLALLLLGHTLEQARPALPTRRVRWSLHGARLQHPEGPLPSGTEGLLQIQPCDWLPEPLELPACILTADHEHLWLRFPPFSSALTDALEGHLFRQHRRQIAQVRATSTRR